VPGNDQRTTPAGAAQSLTEAEERYRALLKINNAIISNLTGEALFRAICTAVRRLIPNDRSAIFLADADRNVLRLFGIESSVSSPRFVVGAEVDSQHSHAGWPFHHQQVLLRRDLEAEREFACEDELFSEGFRSVVSVPLVVKGHSIGAYCIASTEANRYSEVEAEFLGQVAGQIALAVENMRAYEEIDVLRRQMRQAAERNGALLDINNAIITKLTQDELFRIICQALLRIMPYDRVALTLFDEDEQRLRIVALEGQFSSDFFFIGQTVGIDDSHYGWAFARQRPLLRLDMDKERQFPPEERAYAEGVRSSCAVPLIVRGKSIGVINVVSYKKAQYTEADAEFLQAAANQVALAVKSHQDIADSRARLEAENTYLHEEIRKQHNFDSMIGQGPALLDLLRQIELVAPGDSTVLICGETGTGKELVARAIHDRSGRRSRPLITLNCSAIPAGLVESELFGHVKGAFTGAIHGVAGRFELADKGTLFLDEVGELSPETQAKLLRVLQEQEFQLVGSGRTVRVNVRIIAATNRSLEDEVEAGRFRSDLLYRLDVFRLWVPPLRERRSDISVLAHYFVRDFAKRLGKKVETISGPALDRLEAYAWPGNVRELKNVIERAVVLSEGPLLRSDHVVLPSAARTKLAARLPAGLAPTSNRGLSSLRDAERHHILAALEYTGGRVAGKGGAATILGLHPNTLRSLMKRLGIQASRHEIS
jgi:formate hydrogenlyase transcriptional activator